MQIAPNALPPLHLQLAETPARHPKCTAISSLRGEHVNCSLSFFSSFSYFTVYCKTHLDVLLWVFEVFEQSVVTPGDTRLFVGGGVRVTIGLSRLTTKKSVKVGSLLVSSTFLNGVALGALGLEDLGSLLFVWSFAHGECGSG